MQHAPAQSRVVLRADNVKYMWLTCLTCTDSKSVHNSVDSPSTRLVPI